MPFRHAIAAVLTLAAGPAIAMQVAFTADWQEQTFGLFGGGNDFVFRGSALDVGSDDTVSLVWTALPGSAWGSRSASWRWQVDTSVPPTDLTRKGGDDRNLAVYFVFLPAEDARAVRRAGIRALLNDESARVLTYVWGGAHARGEVLRSPYLGDRGRIAVQVGHVEPEAVEDPGDRWLDERQRRTDWRAEPRIPGHAADQRAVHLSAAPAPGAATNAPAECSRTRRTCGTPGRSLLARADPGPWRSGCAGPSRSRRRH